MTTLRSQKFSVINKYTGKEITLNATSDGTTVTVESESKDFLITFKEGDQEAAAGAVDAVHSYIHRTIPPPTQVMN